MILRKETNLYDDDAIALALEQTVSEIFYDEAMFNVLTHNGAIQGLFWDNGQVYANMNYLRSGTIKVGGSGNVNGLLEVYNASQTVTCRLNNEGLYAIAGTIGGFSIGSTNIHNGVTSLSDTSHDGVYIGTDGIVLGKGKFKATSAGAVTAANLTITGGSITGSSITLGGSGNGSGTLIVKDASNNTVVTLNNSGISVTKGSINGVSITLGGSGNANGTLTVKNASNATIGTWNNAGLSATGNLIMEYAASGYVWNSQTGSFTYTAWVNGTSTDRTGQGLLLTQKNTSGTLQSQYSVVLSDSEVTEYISTWNNWAKNIKFNSSPVRGATINIGGSSFNFKTYHPTSSRNVEVSFGGGVGSLEGKCEFIFINGKLEVYSGNIYMDSKKVQFVSSSSIRFKHGVTKNIDEKLDAHALYYLPMKQFIYNDDFDHLQYSDMKGQTLPGFIAEDVAKFYPSAVIHDEEGNIESWDERRIIPGMLALIQEQKKQIDDLQETIDKFKQIIHVA